MGCDVFASHKNALAWTIALIGRPQQRRYIQLHPCGMFGVMGRHSATIQDPGGKPQIYHKTLPWGPFTSSKEILNSQNNCLRNLIILMLVELCSVSHEPQLDLFHPQGPGCGIDYHPTLYFPCFPGDMPLKVCFVQKPAVTFGAFSWLFQKASVPYAGIECSKGCTRPIWFGNVQNDIFKSGQRCKTYCPSADY